MSLCSLVTLHCNLTHGSGSSNCSLVSQASNRGCLDSFSGLRDICSGNSGTVTGFSSNTSFLPSISLQQFSISIFSYTLLLPKESTDEAWEPSTEQCSFGNRGPLDRKVCSHMQSPVLPVCSPSQCFRAGLDRHHAVCSSPCSQNVPHCSYRILPFHIQLLPALTHSKQLNLSKLNFAFPKII